jgi:hypothetical protein
VGLEDVKEVAGIAGNIRRPNVETAVEIHCPHPLGQEFALGSVLLRVLAFDFEGERFAAGQADQIVRTIFQDDAAMDVPKVTLCPTMPYTGDEMMRILAAITRYRDEFPTRGKENALRIRALVLLLRYTGMRIGDAVSLSSERINLHRLFLYTAKTGTPVNTVLPDFVLDALEASPKVTDVHFFWNGRDRPGRYRRKLAQAARKTVRACRSTKGSRASFPRYIRGRTTTGGCANRKSLSSPGTPKREDYRAPLFALGTRSPRAARTGFEARLGTRPCGAHGNEGYTREKMEGITETILSGSFGGAGGNRTHA